MKLLIKAKYWKEISEGKKRFEYRDAHINFFDADTGKYLGYKKILSACVTDRIKDRYPDVLKDDKTVIFVLGE